MGQMRGHFCAALYTARSAFTVAEGRRLKNKLRVRKPGASWNFYCSVAAGWLLLHGRGFIGVLLREALHAAGRIHQLLLASEKRMAVRANFHADHLTLKRGTRVELVAAGAVHLYDVIIGMDSFFHGAPIGQPVCATSENKAAPSRR